MNQSLLNKMKWTPIASPVMILLLLHHCRKTNTEKCLGFCSPSVLLPPSLPEAVLIKALNVREFTEEDWWRDVVVVSL